MRRFLLMLAGLLLLAMPCQAADKRAFVVGINEYDNIPKLKNAVADAVTMAGVLKKLGYQTVLVPEDKTHRQAVLIEFGKFVSSLKPGDDAVIFYSGHGVDVAGANYLVPKDSPGKDDIPDSAKLSDFLIPFAGLIAQVKDKDVSGNVWIIDACRNNPFERPGRRQFGEAGGLSQMSNPAGTFVFFSAAAGAVALDSLRSDPDTEKNGVYTREFSKLIEQRKNDDVRDIAQDARTLIRQITNSGQRPAYYDDLDGPWCFVSCQTQVSLRIQTASASISNPTDFQIVAATKTPARAAPDTDPPNVVYIGRKSFAGNCDKINPDQRPLGCEALTAAAGSADVRNGLLHRPLKTITAVYLRLRAPTVNEKQSAVYSCPVRTLNEGETVQFSGIIDVTLGSETYYWGAVEGAPLKCNDRKPG